MERTPQEQHARAIAWRIITAATLAFWVGLALLAGVVL